jgi:hypothetical protein
LKWYQIWKNLRFCFPRLAEVFGRDSAVGQGFCSCEKNKKYICSGFGVIFFAPTLEARLGARLAGACGHDQRHGGRGRSTATF